MAIAAVFLGMFAWYAGGALLGLFANLVVAFFLALAFEPSVLWLVRRGVRRGTAAAITMVTAALAGAGLLALSGQLFVSQVIQLGREVPALYTRVQQLLAERFAVTVPDADELLLTAVQRWGQELAGRAIGVGSSVLSGVFAATTIVIVTYYLCAAGPRFRASLCRWLAPKRQEEVLSLWEVAQAKVSDFITTRIILAAIATVVTVVFLSILGTPYALPLGLFTGLVSQFVPTIGVYLGGGLPALIALTSQSPWHALGVLAFIVGYQQVENFAIAPKVSARTLEMNPAVSLVVVLAFGAVFGWLGAFLAQPIAATVQAVAKTYINRHELVESAMFHDPGKERLEVRFWGRRRPRGSASS
ncbi:MAG: AI-2E family transporter [Actinomycetales bacterium]|nr:AI-2E family transporter [Actinomycetales bacterium]